MEFGFTVKANTNCVSVLFDLIKEKNRLFADYSRQGLPFPPSAYAEMDNVAQPDRYGTFEFCFVAR